MSLFLKSVGAGRAGTFICGRYILEQVQEEGRVDIFNTLLALSRWRKSLIGDYVCWLSFFSIDTHCRLTTSFSIDSRNILYVATLRQVI